MRLTRIVSCAVLIAASVFFAPGAEAAPIPISGCSATPVTTDVILLANNTCIGTPGIVAGAEGIEIDLNGFVLIGNLGAGDNGVDNTAGHDNVRVVNGVLRNFEFGIRAAGADEMAVKDVVVSGNSGDGIFIAGASVSVKSVTASGNGDDGINISGASASVKSVTASGNAGNGINIGGASASVKSVTASGNGVHGILINGSSASVKSVTASGNAGLGIAISGASASVKSVTASGNGINGISIFGAAASVKSVTASGNGSHGIFVSGDAPVISKNVAHANGFPGGVSNNAGRGVMADGFTIDPTGANVALGNDDPAECVPASLC